jgi:hypothetical protein
LTLDAFGNVSAKHPMMRLNAALESALAIRADRARNPPEPYPI